MKTQNSFQVGDSAKAKSWAWGGRITAINASSVFIRVGNEQTGETYEVPLEECEKIVPSSMQNVALIESPASGAAKYFFQA